MADDAWLRLVYAAAGPQRRRWLEASRSLGSADAVVAASPAALGAFGLGPEQIARLDAFDDASRRPHEEWLRAAPHRRLVRCTDPEYPPLLGEIADPPLALWVEGPRVELLKAPQLAIVGSRSPTAGGRETAEQFARYLSEHGLTITSGLATGIDGASHRGALQGAGSTIAVLGAGLDSIFPQAHAALAREIAARGLLVSEYPPGMPASKQHFPERNRIIAGLAVGTLVVEATMRSGSLITARYAADAGREVFAIPGSIHNPLARGCHFLIRQGAKLVEEAGDIFVELAPLLQTGLPEQVAPAKQTARGSTLLDDPAYRNVLEQLDFAPTPLTSLIGRCQLTAAELSSMLLVLELEGFVEALPGGRYSRLA
jgi:DNA processing protein